MKLNNQTFDPVQALVAAQKAAQAGAKVLEQYFGRLKQVSEKHLAGLVSEADLASEDAIKGELQSLYPAQFLGEESSHGTVEVWPSEGNWWIVDPLDGTTNYIHRFPIYCISIGLMWQGELALGLVHVPALHTTYHATKGGGAYRNGEKISVSERSSIRDSLLATGFFRDQPEALKEQIEIFSKLVFEARGIRRAGAAAYDLCLVAEGVFDAFWEKNLKPWDTAAGTVLVREAGGVVKDYSGADYNITAPCILASNQNIYSTIYRSISDCRTC